MQDKTQVFPLAESDYVRTRLTHSIEASSVGRSLGTLVGDFVKKREALPSLPLAADFGNVVAAACLAHDIGNPPFGHAGENAIRNWFENAGARFLEGLSADQASDFIKFEGNAQGFRLLTRLQNPSRQGGLQLTHAMLGVFSKYPRLSHIPALELSRKVSEKKFGIFAADLESFEAVAKELGLISNQPGAWNRHPLAFLMEAADDICYHIIDLEDGHRVGRVSFKQTEDLLEPIAFADPQNPMGPSYTDIDDEKGKVEYLRALSINQMIYAVVDVFKGNYDAVMRGAFEESLVSKCKYVDPMRRIKEVSLRSIYTAPHVVQIEAAGFEILGGLLDKIVPALVKDPADRSDAEAKLLQLLPSQYKKGGSRYERLLAATDYLSGMTDSYALRLFRRLRGIELPRG